MGPLSQGHPIHNDGLFIPPNENAISAWEDPSYFEMKNWSPFSSLSSFKHQLNFTYKNITRIINILSDFSILSILIIIISLYFY